MNALLKILLFSYFFLVFSVYADQQDLFVEVDQETIKKVTEYNKNSLMEDLYFSKRHRIVEIDMDVLNEEEFVNLNLFEDVNLLVERESLKKNKDTSYFWRARLQFGSLDDIAIKSDSESIFQELGVTPEVLLRQARLVSFYIIDWAVNDKAEEAVFSATVPAGYISNKPFDAPEVSGFTRSAFLSVSGNFTYFPTGQRFAVQPLRYSPRYHIIYEFDQEKRYAVNMDSEDFEFSDEDQLKIRKHKEFYNRLPRGEINKKVIGDFK